MINTIQFLKNYNVFASQARYYTARLFLDELQNNKNLKPNNQKLMKLRIIEEFVSATEDLALWLLVVSKRLDKSPSFDIWERLLLAEATTDEAKNFLISMGKLRSPNSVLKKLDIIPSNKLTKVFEIDEVELTKSLEYIIKAIKTTIQNRKVSNGVLIRAHNKIKHDMAVYLDGNDINNLLIRDLRMVGASGHKRRKNRYLEIRFDVARAEKLVGSIMAISHAIRGLIYLVQADFRYRITTDKRLHRKTRAYWIGELDKTNLE
jgi:hypothetical protein